MGDRVDLEAIKARADAATPGPWEDVVWDDPDEGPSRYVRFNPLHDTTLMHRDEDAEFIAHAREDVPALIAEVVELEALNSDLAEQLTGRAVLAAEVASLRAQRDAALTALDAAEADADRDAAEATSADVDSPAAASTRGRAGGVHLAAEVVRASLGVQPEPGDG